MSDFEIKRVGACVGAVALLGLLAGPAQATDRLVVAMSPPSIESNLIWLAGIAERLPYLQSLVGNDPITGEYDNSQLARSWEHNEDRTEWTFHLHEDAEFHFDWGPVTAHDVVHSYELHTGPDAQYGGRERLEAASVEAIDDHTVVFRFDAPYTDYAFVHAGRVEMMVYSKAQYEAEGLAGYHARPAGSAAYQYKEHSPGERLVIERAPDHWQGIEPDFAEIEFRYSAEASTKLAMLLAGEAHMADLPRELHAQALEAGLDLIASQNAAMTTGVVFSGIYCTTGDPACRTDIPWYDVRIREAMNRAVDREQMMELLYEGRAEIRPSWVFDPRHEGWVPELAESFLDDYGYDPDRARELIEEAGYPDAFGAPIIPIMFGALAGNPEYPLLAELLQVFFEEVGLQTEIREMDWAMVISLGRARQSYMVRPVRNAPVRPTEIGLSTFFFSEGSPNRPYESDTLDALVAALMKEQDQEERERIAAEAFRYMYDNYVDMPLAALGFDMVVNPEVVAGWTFPGATTNSVSHWELIEAVR
jgi:peptide/nickel transport system substrate-binding protein